MGVDCGLTAIELAHVVDVRLCHFDEHLAVTNPKFVVFHSVVFVHEFKILQIGGQRGIWWTAAQLAQGRGGRDFGPVDSKAAQARRGVAKRSGPRAAAGVSPDPSTHTKLFQISLNIFKSY